MTDLHVERHDESAAAPGRSEFRYAGLTITVTAPKDDSLQGEFANGIARAISNSLREDAGQRQEFIDRAAMAYASSPECRFVQDCYERAESLWEEREKRRLAPKGAK